ncbi:hypothetical protein MHK_003610 [Candidatus Magnetomorum sp. HK-1]|nr:hypothetical protein MHK_003610 [Candidatus Magnetomorum sp. HK-1]
MDSELLKISGQVAGIGGVAIGGLILIYKDIIAKKIFPMLTKNQAYSLLKLLIILSWSIALTGIGAWTFVTVNSKNSNYSNGENHPKTFAKPVLDWVNIANEARKNKTIHPNRPLPNELVTKRAEFQNWWHNTTLNQKKKLDNKLLYDALSLTSRLYRIQELQSKTKPSATIWSENAVYYFEQVQNPEFLVESLLDKASIYLELSQIEHTDAEEFRRIAKDGDSVMAQAVSLANKKQKPGAYRIWSRFYYNLARPRDGNLSNNWDNNYLLISYQKMQTAFDIQPEEIKNATQLARITQKSAANPPQNNDPNWTKKLRESQQTLIAKWKEYESSLKTPKNRIPALNVLAVITLDIVRREWIESGRNKSNSKKTIAELEDIALPAQREVLALVHHTEWAEDYDFDMFYDLGRIYSLIVIIMDSIASDKAEGMFQEVIKNFKTARKNGTATQNDAAYHSIESDPNLSFLNSTRKKTLKRIFRPLKDNQKIGLSEKPLRTTLNESSCDSKADLVQQKINTQNYGEAKSLLSDLIQEFPSCSRVYYLNAILYYLKETKGGNLNEEQRINLEDKLKKALNYGTDECHLKNNETFTLLNDQDWFINLIKNCKQ